MSDAIIEKLKQTLALKQDCGEYSVTLFFKEANTASDLFAAIQELLQPEDEPTTIELNPEDLETNKELLIEDCIFYLDAVCDGARSDDAVGFSGAHTAIGKGIAAKLRAGAKLSSTDIIWAQTNLPYYFNTQLTFVPKEFFHKLCERKLAVALAREKAFEEKRADFLGRLHYPESFAFFCKIDLAKVDEKDRSFMLSLRNWRGEHSQRQQPYILKFVEKYLEPEWMEN